jgi:hypothetical protein
MKNNAVTLRENRNFLKPVQIMISKFLPTFECYAKDDQHTQ